MLALSSVTSTFASGDVLRAKAAPAASCRTVLTVECKESRIGKMPVPVPKGVTITIENNKVVAKVRPR